MAKGSGRGWRRGEPAARGRSAARAPPPGRGGAVEGSGPAVMRGRLHRTGPVIRRSRREVHNNFQNPCHAGIMAINLSSRRIAPAVPAVQMDQAPGRHGRLSQGVQGRPCTRGARSSGTDFRSALPGAVWGTSPFEAPGRAARKARGDPVQASSVFPWLQGRLARRPVGAGAPSARFQSVPSLPGPTRPGARSACRPWVGLLQLTRPNPLESRRSLGGPRGVEVSRATLKRNEGVDAVGGGSSLCAIRQCPAIYFLNAD